MLHVQNMGMVADRTHIRDRQSVIIHVQHSTDSLQL